MAVPADIADLCDELTKALQRPLAIIERLPDFQPYFENTDSGWQYEALVETLRNELTKAWGRVAFYGDDSSEFAAPVRGPLH